MSNKLTTQKGRILTFLEYKEISKNKFYTQTGIANGTLDKKSGVTGETILKIHIAYPEINLDWLISGKGEMLESSVLTVQNNLKSVRDQYAAMSNLNPDNIPEEDFLKIESPPEFIPIFSYKGPHRCQGYLSIPNIMPCDGAGYVKTDSMYPIIKPGDIVCYKTANNTNQIYWGEMYIILMVIDGEEYLTIKNIEKSEMGEDYVSLISYNQKYSRVDVLLKNIQWRAIIKAHISYNSIM